jgi:glucan biosynthesis protein C
MSSTSRMYYLDNLRIVLTILVIAHHVGQAYGPTGGYWPVQEAARAAILSPFFTVNRSFFMSLFFMISGYFMIGAYDRNGAAAFIRGRLVRLGVPVLAFAGLMLLARIFLFGDTITRWDDVFNAAHLWYLEHVLLFSLLYAAWRKARGDRVRPGQGRLRLGAPGMAITLAAVIGVAVLSGLVRLWSPIDTWFNLLGFFRVAFADVPRDLAFFVFGAVAYRNGWFESYPTRRGMGWLGVGVAAAVAWYVWSQVSGRLPGGDLTYHIAYPIWESLLCFGMCIGLLVLFRQLFSGQRALGKVLAANQYSAYFWHPLLIVAIQMPVLALPLGPFVKFLLVTAVGVPIVFLWSWLMRKIPAVRAVL